VLLLIVRYREQARQVRDIARRRSFAFEAAATAAVDEPSERETQVLWS